MSCITCELHCSAPSISMPEWIANLCYTNCARNYVVADRWLLRPPMFYVFWINSFSESKSCSQECTGWSVFIITTEFGPLYCVFQSYVHGDEGCAEDEQQDRDKRHAGTLPRGSQDAGGVLGSDQKQLTHLGRCYLTLSSQAKTAISSATTKQCKIVFFFLFSPASHSFIDLS